MKHKIARFEPLEKLFNEKKNGIGLLHTIANGVSLLKDKSISESSFCII